MVNGTEGIFLLDYLSNVSTIDAKISMQNIIPLKRPIKKGFNKSRPGKLHARPLLQPLE